MIFLAAVLALAPAVQSAPTESEIVITARRLKDWRGKASANARESRCRTTRTTGDTTLDQIACDSLRYCMVRLTPAMVAATDRKLTRAMREQRLAALNREIETCGAEQHRLRVADLVERRAASRMNNAQD